MNDNIVRVGNTPIFDQLVRDYERRGSKFEDLIAEGAVDLRPAKIQGYSHPKVSWSDEAMENLGEIGDDFYRAEEPAKATLPVRKALSAPQKVQTFEPVLMEPEQGTEPQTDTSTVPEAYSVSVGEFVRNMVSKALEGHPHATAEDVEFLTEADGSMSVVVTEPVMPGVPMVAIPSVKDEEEVIVYKPHAVKTLRQIQAEIPQHQE